MNVVASNTDSKSYRISIHSTKVSHAYFVTVKGIPLWQVTPSLLSGTSYFILLYRDSLGIKWPPFPSNLPSTQSPNDPPEERLEAARKWEPLQETAIWACFNIGEANGWFPWLPFEPMASMASLNPPNKLSARQNQRHPREIPVGCGG